MNHSFRLALRAAVFGVSVLVLLASCQGPPTPSTEVIATEVASALTAIAAEWTPTPKPSSTPTSVPAKAFTPGPRYGPAQTPTPGPRYGPAPTPARVMVVVDAAKWEYKVVLLSAAYTDFAYPPFGLEEGDVKHIRTTNTLRALGKLGWELVHCMNEGAEGRYVVCIFKRPLE